MCARNSLLLRIEKDILVLDSEIFAAAKLVVLVAPVARMRESSLTKIHIYTKHHDILSTLICQKKKKKEKAFDAFVNARTKIHSKKRISIDIYIFFK